MTITEFITWVAYLEMETERHEKLDWYLAQLTAQVAKGQVKSPRKVKAEHYLLKMATETQQDKMNRSKAALFAALGGRQRVKHKKKE